VTKVLRSSRSTVVMRAFSALWPTRSPDRRRS
jgi:hypothetical protein